MEYQLAGRKVLITGGSRGLGVEIASRFAAKGCDVAINYFSNADAAYEVSHRLAAKYAVKTFVCRGDVGSAIDCQTMVQEAVQELGGLDIVVSNAAWTRFSNLADLDALSEEEWDKCYQTNVKSALHLFRAAKATLNANSEGGVFLYTASTAGVSISGSSLAYSVTKAAGIHLMKCLAQTQGPKIRVNSILPGLLLTEWGNRYSAEFIENWKNSTPLNMIPDIADCARMYVMLAENRSITGQAVEIECGWLLAH